MNDRIHLKNLHVGDVFYDCEYGQSLKCKVAEEPYESEEDNGWRCRVRHSLFSGVDEFFQTNDESVQYLIHFYKEPEYMKII